MVARITYVYSQDGGGIAENFAQIHGGLVVRDIGALRGLGRDARIVWFGTVRPDEEHVIWGSVDVGAEFFNLTFVNFDRPGRKPPWEDGEEPKRACIACRFGVAGDRLECRRNPPTVDQQNGSGFRRFPMVNTIDWCGEFEPKDG